MSTTELIPHNKDTIDEYPDIVILRRVSGGRIRVELSASGWNGRIIDLVAEGRITVREVGE